MHLLTLRFARRDLRGAANGFRLLVLCVALGTAAIAAVGLLSAMILDGVAAGARTSIGGDVSLRLFHAPPEPEHRAAFAAAGTASLTLETRPMAWHAGQSSLIELKAVDGAYPLYGKLTLRPPLSSAEALKRRDGVWGAAVGEPLLAALKASLGDIVTVGGRRFELRALVETEPDRALRAFSLGPRMIVALPAIADADLVAPGTQTYWYSRIRLEAGRDAAAWIADFTRRFPDAGFRIVNADDGVPGVERSLALVTSLLLFVAMGILLIGSVGISSSVAAYLDRKRQSIAILRSLGAEPAFVLRLYLVQTLAAALVGVAVGLSVGVLLSYAAMPYLSEWLPVSPGLRLGPLAIAGGFGLLVTLLFAWWPLSKAELLPPQVLFRALVAPARTWPKPRRLAAMGLWMALLAALLVVAAPLPAVAVAFALAAICVTFCFFALGRLMTFAARRASRLRLSGMPLLRIALANLHRPGAPTASLVMATGLGLTLLVAVAALRDNANRHLAATLPETAPDLIVLNIPPAQGADYDAHLAAIAEVVRWERVPFLHGQVSRIAGVPVAERQIPADIAFVIRGDRGFSWRSAPPRQGITAGEWWPADYTGPPLVSLAERAAHKLGVTVGDSLTLTVLGKPVQARIANLRTVDWAGLDLDFPVLLSPPSDPPPHREIAALWVAPEAAVRVKSELAEAFPETPTILVDEVIRFLQGVADHAATLLTAVSAATGLAALPVLGGAVAASRRRRTRESVLLKTLGATRRQALGIAAIEFGLIGLAAATAALLLGNLAAWAAIGDFAIFRPALTAALPWIAVAFGLLQAIGLTASWRALARPPAEVLRQA